MRRPGMRSPLSRIDDLALQQALFEQPRHGGPRSWRASGRPQRLIPCLPICVAILAIASFPQTLSRAMRLPAFPSPTSCYFRPTFLMRTPETFPTRKFVSSVHRAAAHCTCRPSAGRRWRSRCAPRTRPARCCAGSKIATRRAPRRQARQMRQHHIADAIDQFVDLVHPHQFALLLQQAQLQWICEQCREPYEPQRSS